MKRWTSWCWIDDNSIALPQYAEELSSCLQWRIVGRFYGTVESLKHIDAKLVRNFWMCRSCGRLGFCSGCGPCAYGTKTSLANVLTNKCTECLSFQQPVLCFITIQSKKLISKIGENKLKRLTPKLLNVACGFPFDICEE